MQSADVDEVVRVHLAAFPSFFLTFLGPRFLRELYDGIVADPGGIAFVAVDGSRCAGFVAGTDAPADFYRRLIRRRVVRFAGAAFVPFLRRPSVAGRLLRAVSRPAVAAARQGRHAELMSLAVSPSHRQRGAGARLVERFLEESRNRGATADRHFFRSPRRTSVRRRSRVSARSWRADGSPPGRGRSSSSPSSRRLPERSMPSR
jgi:ribosomal protein S18 acetylase RimI-like enzyme